MGLDTTHGCWHGPYSSFNRFRERLAKEAGYDLNEYDGYGGHKDLTTIDHPLMPLFNHSDCDGILTVEESFSLVKGLNLIIQNTIDHPLDNFKQQCIEFRDGCLLAIQHNEEVEFR